MSEWQPIETAPTDRNCLGYGIAYAEVGPGSDEAPTIMEVRWSGKRWVPVAQTYYSLELYPTHWMPLPDAPKGAVEQSGNLQTKVKTA